MLISFLSEVLRLETMMSQRCFSALYSVGTANYCANGLHTKISSVRFACAHSKILASHGPSHGVISASNSSASQDQSTDPNYSCTIDASQFGWFHRIDPAPIPTRPRYVCLLSFGICACVLLDTLGLRQIKQKFRLAKSLPAVSCNNSVGLDHASSGLLMSNHVGLDHVSCNNLCSGIVSNHSNKIQIHCCSLDLLSNIWSLLS